MATLRLVRFLLALAVLAVLLFLLRVPLLRAIGRSLVVSDAPAHADAIVVLSGSIPDRILWGADLYRQGMAPRLLLTREVEAPGLAELRKRGLELPERSDINLTLAQELGVPRDAIDVVGRPASSTISEISSLLPELRRLGVHSLLLVTSKTHSRRAAAIFRALAGGEFSLRVCPTPYDTFSAEDWWRHREVARRVITESAKWLLFELVDRWRTQSFLDRGNGK